MLSLIAEAASEVTVRRALARAEALSGAAKRAARRVRESILWIWLTSYGIGSVGGGGGVDTLGVVSFLYHVVVFSTSYAQATH